MGELLKLSAILTLICSCAAFSLGLAYKHTKEPIAEQQRLKKVRALKAVFDGYDIPADLPFVDLKIGNDKKGMDILRRFYLIQKDGEHSGVAFEVSSQGYGGNIQLMTGLTSNGNISGIKVLNHAETPGLGANINTEKFTCQFRGMNLDETVWKVKKTGGDVDQVTGATISSSAVLEAVHDGIKFAAEHKSEIISNKTDS
jgi:electron transport complex protein RnfG